MTGRTFKKIVGFKLVITKCESGIVKVVAIGISEENRSWFLLPRVTQFIDGVEKRKVFFSVEAIKIVVVRKRNSE